MEAALEKFEMLYAVGVFIVMFIGYAAMGVVFFVIASKKKRTNPPDAKNWKILGIIFFCIAGFGLLCGFIAFGVPALLSEAAVLIV